MRISNLHILPLAGFLLIVGVTGTDAQVTNGISPEQARRLSQTPQGARLIHDRLRQSGLSDNEIRARLRQAGYSSDLLDPFLSEEGAPDEMPGADILSAVAMLGVGGFTDEESLLFTSPALPMERAEGDSALVMPDSSVLPLFGLNTFRRATSEFQPLLTGPVAPTYRLGPGDQLVLILTGDVELARILDVTGEGFLVIPDVGQISVNNLTMEQFRQLLTQRLGRSYSGIRRGTTQFELSVSRVRVISVRVTGEVAIPGTYPIAATASPIAALYRAGGLTERSNFRNVLQLRGADTLATFDLYDYLLSGVIAADAPLQSGDVVFVPIAGPRVKVVGEVRRPARYELMPSETLRELIQAAGGPTALAHYDNATITRILPPEARPDAGNTRTVLSVNLGNAVSGSTIVPILDGDSVTVFSVRGPRRSEVKIAGSVWQPGSYELDQGMRFWDLIQAAGGLKPETYRGAAQISRKRPDSTRVMLPTFRLPENDMTPPAENPVLQEFDEIRIFASTEFRTERQVAVYGSVNMPDSLVYIDSMTLRDAILMAGGLTDDAYLLEVEITRQRDGSTEFSDSLATRFFVQIDSSYVFDDTNVRYRPTGTARSGSEVHLQPFDRIFVRKDPSYEPQRTVHFTGEVYLPGRYTLLTREERLLDVLQRAGGITGQGYPEGVRFFRRGERIDIELPRVLEDPEFRENLILAAGDSIDIPQFIPTVRVEGAVLSPTTVAYHPNASTRFYIDAAGGYTHSADKRRTFIQQPNGGIERRNERPEPGATVVVPAQDPDKVRINLVTVLGTATTVLSNLVTMLFIIKTFN